MYVLCYDNASEAQARSIFGPLQWASVMRLGPSKWMEGQVFMGLLEARRHEWEDADFVGTLSWRSPEKINIPDFTQLCTHLSGADVIGLLPMPEPLLKSACLRHPRFVDVWFPLLRALGYSAADILNEEMPTFMCNYWLATPHWMQRYCDFYKRATHVLEHEPELQGALWSHSGYSSGLTPTQLQGIFGKPYYPHHPFVCERLPCFFFWKEGAVVAMTPPLVTERFWLQMYGRVPQLAHPQNATQNATKP